MEIRWGDLQGRAQALAYPAHGYIIIDRRVSNRVARQAYVEASLAALGHWELAPHVSWPQRSGRLAIVHDADLGDDGQNSAG